MNRKSIRRESGVSSPRDPSIRRFHRRRDADPTLYRLTNALVAARVRAGLTQQEVGRRMGTIKSAVSRPERGFSHRPTLTTIENYVLVVGCRLDISVRSR
ncbi:MAG: helix-turn-helix transcriptional regulator [Casimicrobiaceae bacterium]|nr:helix-turn-helix domain-containing protein [Pseudomonadota bacterium]